MRYLRRENHRVGRSSELYRLVTRGRLVAWRLKHRWPADWSYSRTAMLGNVGCESSRGLLMLASSRVQLG